MYTVHSSSAASVGSHMTLQHRWCPTNPWSACHNRIASMSDTWGGLVLIVSCSFSSSQVSPPSSPSWFVPKCSQLFGPCCIHIFIHWLKARLPLWWSIFLFIRSWSALSMAVHVNTHYEPPPLRGSWQKVTRRSEGMTGRLTCVHSVSRLTGYRRGTKHCRLPLNSPISERSH